MDSQIDHFKEEIDFTDNNDKLDKLKKSYLILKQKVCRSHDLIKLYNDKLKECERIKIDLDLANKETKKMTSNYNLTLAKVIKLELQNTEYKKDIETLTNTIVTNETKMASDKQHLLQLTCKMKELEEIHMDKIMQLDLDKSLLQDNIKELKCQLKVFNKTCDSSKKKSNKRQQNIENDANSEGTLSTVDVAVNTESSAMSTMDVAVNTVGSNMKVNTLIEKSVMTDISWNINKNDLYPLFCNECERILSNPCEIICRSMTKHPQLIELISSPIKSLPTESTFISERDENLTNYFDNNEICNLEQSSGGTSANNNSLTSPTVSLKPELPLQDHHIIRSKPFSDLRINPITLSNQLNGLSNTVKTPCVISESNSLCNLTTSANPVHILEKLEEKMKRLEKRIKKQSRKKKQLSTNHLQYFPHMNCYPNDILSQNLSLNMASTFWNEVKNLMNDKQNKCAENQKKRHESKLCKFSSKKIKLKHRLKQNNILLRNNAWNVEPMVVDDSTETDHLEDLSVNVLSNTTKNDPALDNFSNTINLDKDKCCSASLEETTENTTLFSPSKKTSHATSMQDDESFELSSCEDIKDNISNSIEDTNSSDFNDTQCYNPTVKVTTEQMNDISFTSERFDTKNKNYFQNKITDTIATTVSNDTTVINNIVTTTGKTSTASTSATMSNKFNESGPDKQTSISNVNEFTSTEFILEEMSEIVNNVSPNARISNSIDKYKDINCTTIAANSVTVANTCPTTNFTTTVTCLTNNIITTTNNVSIDCKNKSITTTSSGILTRAQKRRFQYNSQTDLLSMKKNNETVCNVENNQICNNKITRAEDTSENGINNKSDNFEDCISRKKQCISHEVKMSSNQSVPSACKASDRLISPTNLNKSNNYDDTPKVNTFISKEGKSTEATIMNSIDFITNVNNNECIQEQSNNESPKAGHSNSIKNVDLHIKSKFGANKANHARIMENLKNLRSRPPCKLSGLELSHSREPITEDNKNSNQNKCVSQIIHNKNSLIKNSEDKCTPQSLCKKNTEVEHNEDKCLPQILCKKNNVTKHNEDKDTSKIVSNRNSEITNNIIKSYSNLNKKEEYKLQSKSVDLNTEMNLNLNTDPNAENEDENDIEKSCNFVNAKEESVLQKTIDEAQRFPCINGVNKINKIDLEVPTTTTGTAICNENNVDNQPHKMDIIAPENTRNIDTDASISLEAMSPVMLLENHLNKNKRPKGLRTSRKTLKKMTEICKATDNFVVRQLHRIIGNPDWSMSVHTDVVNKLSSMCTVRIVANAIVEFMLDRAMHNLDKSYTPPAPLMTSAQQRITALLVDLEIKMPTVIKYVQIGIEYKIFRLNKTPMLHQVQNLVRLYVVLARIQKDREKIRILCCDALYCLGLHAIPVIYIVLTSWPEIFPQFTENTDILPTCMAHIVSSFQAIDFPQLQPLKSLISSYYKFKAGNYVTINLMEELLNSLEGNHFGTGIVSLKTAIILLAKKEGTSWTYAKVIQANLLPRIVNRKYSSIFEAFCLLGHLLRTFPIENNDSIVKNITEQLSDLIESGEGSEDQQEGIISALLSLCRHQFEKVSKSVMKWKPTKPMRAFTIDQCYALFSLRTAAHWKAFLRNTINKM